MENWKVRISQEYTRFGNTILIYRRISDGKLELWNLNNPDSPLVIEEGVEVKRSEGFYLPNHIFNLLVDAIHKDFKPSEGKYTEGKLEGTERHLEDLRKLLKLK